MDSAATGCRARAAIAPLDRAVLRPTPAPARSIRSPFFVASAPALNLPNVSRRLFSIRSSGRGRTCPVSNHGSRAATLPKPGVSASEAVPRADELATSRVGGCARVEGAAQVPSEGSFRDQSGIASNRISNSEITRLETRLTRRKQTSGASPNSEFLRVCNSHRRPLATRHLPPLPAFLIDTACQLEIDLTPCRINAAAISNRRWIAALHSRLSGPVNSR